jgi:hypothetical protein
VANLERKSGDYSGRSSAALPDAISHYTSARYSVGCARSGLICWKQGETVAGVSDPVTNTNTKHISREGFQEFLAVSCKKTLGKIFDGAMQMPTTYIEL